MHDRRIDFREDVVHAQTVVLNQVGHVQAAGDRVTRIDPADQGRHAGDPRPSFNSGRRPGEQVGLIPQVPQTDSWMILEARHHCSEQQLGGN